MSFIEFALIGATASGKTALAIDLAREIGGVILSLDSLCVYREINIASAKPTLEERAGVKHFGLDLVSLEQPFCAGDFTREYFRAREFAKSADCPLIITGGSGFYLGAMTKGLSPRVPTLPATLSNAQIWEIASAVDPEFCAKFSANDTFRLQKWLEIYEFSHRVAPSKWLKENTCEPVISNLKIFEIVWERSVLRERIVARTRSMIEGGLLDEARELFSRFDSNLKPLKSVGLKECGEYLSSLRANGESAAISDNSNLNYDLSDLDLAGSPLNSLFDLIATHTAQLAKRQRTFNRSQFPSRVELTPQTAKGEILAWLGSNLK